MRVRRSISEPPKKCKKKSWDIQPLNEIVLLWVIKSVASLGTTTELKAVSRMDKLAKKKYMGDRRRHESIYTINTMRRFPNRMPV